MKLRRRKARLDRSKIRRCSCTAERDTVEISPDWTDTERLRLIARLMRKILAQPKGLLLPGAQRDMHRWAETAALVATHSSAFLEVNRGQILADSALLR